MTASASMLVQVGDHVLVWIMVAIDCELDHVPKRTRRPGSGGARPVRSPGARAPLMPGGTRPAVRRRAGPAVGSRRSAHLLVVLARTFRRGAPIRGFNSTDLGRLGQLILGAEFYVAGDAIELRESRDMMNERGAGLNPQTWIIRYLFDLARARVRRPWTRPQPCGKRTRLR
jgi:hypothetical protein